MLEQVTGRGVGGAVGDVEPLPPHQLHLLPGDAYKTPPPSPSWSHPVSSCPYLRTLSEWGRVLPDMVSLNCCQPETVLQMGRSSSPRVAAVAAAVAAATNAANRAQPQPRFQPKRGLLQGGQPWTAFITGVELTEA